MTPDPFRRLDAYEPPDRWNEILCRVQDPKLALTDLPALGIRRHATGRILVIAAAALVLVMISVAAFGAERPGETVDTDQATDPRRTTTSTTATTSPPATTSDPSGATVPSRSSDGPVAPASPDGVTIPDPTTPPAPTTTVPPEPADRWPDLGLGLGHETAPTPTSVLGGPCPAYLVNDLATLRPGPSPVWSVAGAVLGDGSSDAPDESWPPHAVAHGEISALGVHFEVGMGIGVATHGEPPVVDLSAHLARDDDAPLIAGQTWPGIGYAGTPAPPDPTRPPERTLHLPPVPEGAKVVVAVLSFGIHPDPACGDVYIAAIDSPTQVVPDPLVLAVDFLVDHLRPGSPPP